MGQALWQASAIEIAAGIRERRFSCSAVTISVAERIRALNPKLNAIVADLTDQALAEAAAADRSFKSVAEHGPLFGVPVTIKVNIDVEGQATTNGLAAFADLIAPGDSPVVSNLRRAGLARPVRSSEGPRRRAPLAVGRHVKERSWLEKRIGASLSKSLDWRHRD